MNGWDEGHPAWWLNLEATPDAVVRLAGQTPRPVRARAAAGEERERLWQRWAAIDRDLDAYAAGGRPRRPWSFSSLATKPPEPGRNREAPRRAPRLASSMKAGRRSDHWLRRKPEMTTKCCQDRVRRLQLGGAGRHEGARRRAAADRPERTGPSKKADGCRRSSTGSRRWHRRIGARRARARGVTANAPELTTKTWYGMPAYANADGKIVIFFQDAGKPSYRYSTLGFQDTANSTTATFGRRPTHSDSGAPPWRSSTSSWRSPRSPDCGAIPSSVVIQAT